MIRWNTRLFRSVENVSARSKTSFCWNTLSLFFRPVQRLTIALLRRAELSKLWFKQTDARVRNSKPSTVSAVLFLPQSLYAAEWKKNNKLQLTRFLFSYGSYFRGPRTDNKKQRGEDKAKSYSAIHVSYNTIRKCCSENIRAYIFSERRTFRYKLHIPSWSYPLDHLAQYNEHRLLLLYYVIINYLHLHVKLNFNDLLSFCLHGLSWKLGVLSFWWINLHSKNITRDNDIVGSVVTPPVFRRKLIDLSSVKSSKIANHWYPLGYFGMILKFDIFPSYWL